MPTFAEDVVAWAEEQARLLRAGRFAELDLVHLAEESEDLGKSEVTSRMAVLIGHLLQSRYQPERRAASGPTTIQGQRKEIDYNLAQSTSLRGKLRDPCWVDLVWTKGAVLAATETGLECFPEAPIWSFTDEVPQPGWLPD